MDQSELELQLDVWKELAVGKQMLMRVATDALGLDPECNDEELQAGLKVVIQKAQAAEDDIYKAQQRARAAIAAMEKKVKQSERAVAVAETAQNELQNALQNAEQRIVEGRESSARDLKKLTTQLAEKQKNLKAINAALADTPENVVKKLNALKKEKRDEATARKRAEAGELSLRKDKQQLEQSLKEVQALLGDSGKVVEHYRELQKFCLEQQEQLKTMVDDEGSLAAIPESLDEELLEKIEQAIAKEKEVTNKKTKQDDG